MPSSAFSRRNDHGSWNSESARCRDSGSTGPLSASRPRVRQREDSSRRWPSARPSASGSRTAGSVSQGNGLFGVRALRAARSPSTGGSCSRRSRCSSTWSCTSSATCVFRTIRDGSGHSSSDIAHAGASSATGCATTDQSSWHSARTTQRARHAGSIPGETTRRKRNSPSRWRFCPLSPLTFRFRVRPPG